MADYDITSIPSKYTNPPPGSVINRIGEQRHRVTVIGFCCSRKNNHPLWWYLCKCGNIKHSTWSNINNGNTKSCGCKRREDAIKRGRIKSNASGTKIDGKRTPEYRSWEGMKRRCYYETSSDYDRYGARGIRVCSRWFHSFQNFRSDMGKRPPGTTLNRIHNNLNYSCGKCDECHELNWPNNCKWSTYEEQSNNKENTIIIYDLKGYGHTIRSISNEFNIAYFNVLARYHLGWTYEKIISTPVRRRPRIIW